MSFSVDINTKSRTWMWHEVSEYLICSAV